MSEIEEKKKGGKATTLVYQHSDKLKIEKDAYNWIVNHNKKTTYYPSLSGAVAKVSDILLIQKLEKIPDEEKQSFAYLVKLIREHDENIRGLFGEH